MLIDILRQLPFDSLQNIGGADIQQEKHHDYYHQAQPDFGFISTRELAHIPTIGINRVPFDNRQEQKEVVPKDRLE